jgi:hypothetical protein
VLFGEEGAGVGFDTSPEVSAAGPESGGTEHVNGYVGFAACAGTGRTTVAIGEIRLSSKANIAAPYRRRTPDELVGMKASIRTSMRGYFLNTRGVKTA